ncbi:helix-turn-helix domain-containing protein [Paenibacillus sp. J2TS4]|uniref:helix-turn-helix domain-containing protein n=1 Tax=Paenibacillus sp. J2TS4 TaxID=2807194 RepID=UPI001B039483|nr:helix-turn-helix domain-containing protein [Paenibacillus sp. J2TS4]GIP35017.1 HTH-type transcriptional regulator YesS [Paenibacillus sp. J2TS4]
MFTPFKHKVLPSLLRTRQNGFYRKSLIILLLVTSIPTALLAIATYYVGTKQIEQEVHRAHEFRLETMADKLQEQLLQLEKMSTMWTFFPILQGNLGEMTIESFKKEIVFTHDLAKMLLIMGDSNPLIREVRLYLPDSGLYISPLKANVAVPINNPEELEFFRSLYIKEMPQYWTVAQGYLSLIRLVPDKAPYGYFLTIIDEEAMNQLIQTEHDSQATAFMLKGNGDWLDPEYAKEAEYRPFEYMLRQQVNEQNRESGSFYTKWNGEKYTVSFGTIPRTGWIYVSATSLSNLTQPVVYTSRILLAVGGLGMVVAICLSWFASLKLYQPIVRLMQLFRSSRNDAADATKDEIEFIEREWQFLNSESKLLHERMEQNLVNLREIFLFQLLHDHLNHLTEDELRRRMEQYGWDTEGKVFQLLVVRLLGFSKLLDRFDEGDEQLVTFAASNVIAELATGRFEQAEIVNEQELSVSILVVMPEELEPEETRQQLYEFGDSLIQSLSAILRMNVLVGLASQTSSISELPEAYREVNLSFGFRNVQEMNQILDLEQMGGHPQVSLYPFALEKEWVRSVRSGERDEAVNLLRRFVEELTTNGEKEIVVRQGMNQLLGVLLHHILLSGFSPQGLYSSPNLYDELNKLREPDEMLAWFKEKLEMYMDTMTETMSQVQDQWMKETVDKVIAWMAEEYAQDISLESYSDRFGISIYKLSSGFKEVTGVNFIDYLTRLRLDKSKELLLTTNDKVNDIAYRVGYQPSYYYRVFKKHEGLTPTKYREMYREGP